MIAGRDYIYWRRSVIEELREPIIRLALTYRKRDAFEGHVKMVYGPSMLNDALWLYDEIWSPNWTPPDWFIEKYATKRIDLDGVLGQLTGDRNVFSTLVLLSGALGIVFLVLRPPTYFESGNLRVGLGLNWIWA
jgi:hypothetical protein